MWLQVRNIARRMVAQWGFANDAMGDAPVAWETPEGNGLTAPRAPPMTTSQRRTLPLLANWNQKGSEFV